MGKELVAKGQVTITTLDDAYHVSQSVGEYIFPALPDGTVAGGVTVTSTVKVTQGNVNHSDFTIGAISKPAGFSSIVVDNAKKTITYTVSADTTTLSDHGSIVVPVIIGGITYSLSFQWAKAKSGTPGVPGTDANLLDWVKDWNTNKTQINSATVITPKIYAGIKHSDGTLTGTAIGHFMLNVKDATGNIASETVDGIYGFKAGYKTFYVDNAGNAQLGQNDQYIKYNASTGKVEFGSGVSLNWIDAINRAKAEAVNSAATDATNKVNAIKIGNRNYIRNSRFIETLTGIHAEGTSISVDATELYNGCKTLKVVQSTACTDSNAASYRTYFTAINNKICLPASFSMYIKASVPGNLKIRIGSSGIQIKSVATNWQKITLENIQATSAVVLFGFATVGTFWCALPMLVEGSKAADWSPAPEDLESRIADAKKAGTDARSVADAITNKANTEGWATKLTYIDKSGIFTGTLSANIVNALRLNATQITAGVISAERLDINSLKSSLITAGNIEALTLRVTKGNVGGWNIDNDSIFRGTKNNTAGGYTSASGSVTLGSNGLRGLKWRLEATGAGAVAGGNISWDASGNVTFGSAVTLLWSTPINSITTALGGSGYPKVTKITAEGIYTGSVTASQITSGTISADRIAAGSIHASKLDATSIKTSIINATYIDSLSCNFVRGKIGGWTINSGSLTGTHIALDNGNKRIVVYGANSDVTSGKRVQLYYTSDSDFGLYATDTSGNCVAQLGAANKIAGWILNSSQIYKNNVYLGADGSISNGSHWKLNNDGSGQIANGNITWNASGAVTFSSAVSLNWTNLINNIQVGGRNYVRSTSCKWLNFSGFTNIANECILPYTVYCPDWKAGEVFTVSFDYKYSGLKSGGNKLISLQGSGNVTSWTSGFSGTSLLSYINWTNGSGEFHISYSFTLSTEQAKNASFSLNFRHDYISAGTVSIRNFKIEKGNKATAWSAAPEDINGQIGSIQTALGGSSYSKLTKIDGNGIYTGTLVASQISSGTISADRIAAGSLNASKLDAASIKSSIINTDYINGLSCTFVRGKIGGFTIGGDNMSVGSIGGVGATPLQIRSASSGSGYWYSGAYKPFGVVLTWRQSGNAGHIVFGQIASSGNAVKTGFVGIQMLAWDNTEYFCLSANYTKSGSKEVYNRIAGWAFDNTRIWKNNVSLGSDGSLYNGEKWRLNNDGSGKIAGGNISWNASGAVTFSSSVTLNWTNAATNALNSAKSYADTKKTEAINAAATDAANRVNSLTIGGRNFARDTATMKTYTLATGAGNLGYPTKGLKKGDVITVSFEIDINIPSWTSGTKMLQFNQHYGYMSFYNFPQADNQKGWLKRSTQLTIGNVWNTTNPTTEDLISEPYMRMDNLSTELANNGYVKVRNLKVEKGNKATDWSPSPEDAASRLTRIDANGIYTGTISAGQINAGTISADRIAAGSINSSKLDANSIKANIINASYINGLTCAFVRGTIGGWSITSSSIAKNGVALNSDGTISNGAYWVLNRDGSGKLAQGNIIWDAAGNTEFKGRLSGASGTFDTLTAIKGGGGITFNNAGISINGTQFWVYGDMYSQGTTNNRPNRYYSSNIWCRGSFGYTQLNVVEVYGYYAYYYPDGYGQNKTRIYVSLKSATNNQGQTYYTIPLYSPPGYDALAGFPVNFIKLTWSGTNTTYRYVLDGFPGQNIIAFNANDNSNDNTRIIYCSGRSSNLAGGELAHYINVGNFNLYPAIPSSNLGAGWLVVGFRDNDWR